MNLDKMIMGHDPLPIGTKKKYSVMIPVISVDGIDHIVFEKRSGNISQPGEVSLPGGKVEDGESFKEAAIRETVEELEIPMEHIEIIGESDFLVTADGRLIRVYVARIYDFLVEEFSGNDEVDMVFAYPVSYFLENKPTEFKSKTKMEFQEDFPFELINGGRDYPFSIGDYIIPFYRETNPVIWGFTAKIINGFIDILERQRL